MLKLRSPDNVTMHCIVLYTLYLYTARSFILLILTVTARCSAGLGLGSPLLQGPQPPQPLLAAELLVLDDAHDLLQVAPGLAVPGVRHGAAQPPQLTPSTTTLATGLPPADQRSAAWAAFCRT